ncbi:MAG: hypothetical protein ACYCZO_13675, partial [Daejeonella sp.]
LLFKRLASFFLFYPILLYTDFGSVAHVALVKDNAKENHKISQVSLLYNDWNFADLNNTDSNDGYNSNASFFSRFAFLLTPVLIYGYRNSIHYSIYSIPLYLLYQSLIFYHHPSF